MSRTDYIGLRVARWRDIAGITQKQLGDRIGRSREFVSRIENGHIPVTQRHDLYAIATALGVSVTDLTGQPEQPRTRNDLAIYSAIPALRGALDDEPESADPVDVDALRADVDRAMAARMACDYSTLSVLLPGLVADTRRFANGRDTEAGLGLFIRAAVCAALTIKPFGYVDLAARFAERAELAAGMRGRRADMAAARFASAQTALASGTSGGRRRSYAVAAGAADELGATDSAETLSWHGLLNLHAAMAAASLGHTDDVATHLAEAESAASRVEGDPWLMEFTPANVGVWRTAIALEGGEPGRAAEYARRVNRGGLRTKQRRAHLHIAAGRGLYLDGRPDKAVRQFLQADEVACAELRSRPSVREIVGQMVRDARRQGSSELRELAVRVGVDPLDPDLDSGQPV